MLTVFDNGIGYPLAYDDYYVRQLASGLNEVIFNISIWDENYKYIKEEAKVLDRNDQEYLIKQVDAGDKTAKVVCQINIDDWKGEMHLAYTNNSATVGNTISSVAPSGWSVVDQSQKAMRRTIPENSEAKDFNVTSWEIVQECCETYSVRVQINTKSKILYIVDPDRYTSLGAFATRDLNLVKLNYKGKSDNFVTRLYAVGADGMTFESINNGKPYVENFNYSNKVVSAYWKDDRYTVKQNLLDDAIAKLAEMAKPTRSYDCEVLDLAKTNPGVYSFEDFSLFNIVTLVDDIRGERVDYQIVERWDYPYYPHKNKVVLSTATPNLQSVVTAIVSAINNPVSVFSQKLQSAVINTTELITGNRGGYLILRDSDGDGNPDELLIMDTDSIETATKVWRWNQAGLGYSGSGYNGPYTLGMNMNGQINADMITAGQLNGEIIEAGTINTAALSVDTMQDLNQMHDYLPYDLWTNIYRWGGSYSRLTLGTITVGGEEYQAMTMDCSEYTVGDTNNMTWIDSDFIGMPTMHVEFDCIFPSQLVLASDVSWFYITYSHSHSSYKKFHKIPAGTYEANTPYHFSFDISPSQDADGSDINARLGFTRGIATVVSIYNWTVKGTQANYNRASMTMNKYGLSSIVQSGNIISSINQSSESVDIQASKINLTGDLSLRGDFTSYNSVDAGTKAFLDDGTLAFYVGNGHGASDINFVVSANYFGSGTAGIAFGDPQDPLTAMHTLINQDVVKAVNLLAYYNGSQGTSAFGPDDTLLSEGTAQFHGGIIVNDDVLYNALGTHIVNVFFNPTQFNDTVMNSSGGTVFTSDRRKKRSIKDLAISKARSFIMGLKPIKYKFTKDISKSDRYHHGFIAQDVKEVMPEDWGLYCEDKDDDFIGLRYDEFIADMVAVIQDQEKRIESLERAIYDKSNNQS